jgi:methionyl-tRNA formyltransferase
VPKDKKYAGLKDFEWNNTVTQEQKNAKRARKLAYDKIKKEREIKQKEYFAAKKIRDEEYAIRRAE